MIKMVPYTDLERDTIANEIRKFAESPEYDHCMIHGKSQSLTVHQVPHDRQTRSHLRMMAALIQHNIHI